MHFINASFLSAIINERIIACVVFALLLSACGAVQEKNTAGDRLQRVTVPASAQQAYRQVLDIIDAQQWDKAEVLLQQMLLDYPQLLSLRASLGWVYWQANNIEAAITTLTPLLDNPALYKPDAFNTLAIIYREQGDFQQAAKHYQQAIAIWPNDPLLHQNLGILYDLYLGELDKALRHYRQAQGLQVKKNKKKNKQLNGWIKDLERRLP
ncbi:MAG: tetratricopeptide repeat protein [Cellvibrionaceae bacterium]|nr:tetratricopeptide repeat protein [Cellvibrionaceae bacterium]